MGKELRSLDDLVDRVYKLKSDIAYCEQHIKNLDRDERYINTDTIKSITVNLSDNRNNEYTSSFFEKEINEGVKDIIQKTLRSEKIIYFKRVTSLREELKEIENLVIRRI